MLTFLSRSGSSRILSKAKTIINVLFSIKTAPSLTNPLVTTFCHRPHYYTLIYTEYDSYNRLIQLYLLDKSKTNHVKNNAAQKGLIHGWPDHSTSATWTRSDPASHELGLHGQQYSLLG